MKTFKMKSLATATAAAALGLGMASSAHALIYNVTLYDTVNTANFVNVTVADGSTYDSDGTVNNSIGLNLPGALAAAYTPTQLAWLGNNYSVNSSTAKVIESSGRAYLETGSLGVSNNTGTSVRAFVLVSDNGLQGPRNFVQDSASATFGGVTTASVSTYFFNDPTNGSPVSGSLSGIGAFNSFVTGLNIGNSLVPGSEGYWLNTITLSGTSGQSKSDNYGLLPLQVNDSGLFAMSAIFDFTLDNGESLAARGATIEKFSQAPEPATISLLGAGLIGLAAARRRKAKTELAA